MAWVLLVLLLFTVEAAYTNLLDAFLYAANICLFQMVLVYSHYELLLPWLQRKKYVQYVIGLLVTVLFCVAITAYNDQVLIPYTDFEYWAADNWWTALFLFPLSIVMLGASGLYYIIELWHKKLQKESQLHSEKLLAELNFLKSQINPHFLFNTLNNIYAYVQTGHPNTAPMLERLSSILRYMVYDCSASKVALLKEVQAIEDLFEMYKMKNSGQQNLSLQVQGVKGYHLVAPLILINLVENAFKHSDALNNAAGYINITLGVTEAGRCTLTITNTVKQAPPGQKPDGGIGLENTLKRLALQYGSAYTLEQNLQNAVYKAALSLPLEYKT